MEQTVKVAYIHSPASDDASADETTCGQRDAEAFVGEEDDAERDMKKVKPRMVECEEVEDEYDVWYRETTKEQAEEEDEEDDDEEKDDDDDDEKDDEEDEDEDEGGEDYEEDEDDEFLARHRTLWTCDICNTTINIFAQDDHYRSASHLQNTGNTTQAAYDQPPPPPRWQCTVCNEEMSIFQQPPHLASKPHLKMLLHHSMDRHPTPAISVTSSTHPPFTDIPAPARSSELEFRNTFYCITCASEFDLAEQELHLSTRDIWVCELCSARMHPAARDAHVDSETHAVNKRRSKAPEEDIFCSVCQGVYTLGEMDDHLAGALHRTANARAEFEKQCLAEKNKASASTGPRSSGTLPNEDATKAWYCDICKKVLVWEHLASHLVSHCRTPVPPSPAPAPGRKPAAKTKTAKPPSSVKSLYCDVCNKYFCAQGMADHKYSKKHMKKAAANSKAPRQNKQATGSQWYITIVGSSFRCEVCNRTRKVVGMRQHMDSGRHIQRLAAANRV